MPGKLTNEQIRHLATAEVFQRGYEYYQDGAVVSLEQRANRLFAEVEGSEYKPYKVSITLRKSTVASTNCTCPYDWGGACKHIIAVLLIYVNDPEDVEQHPTIEQIVADLSADELRALIVALVSRWPKLARVVEGLARGDRKVRTQRRTRHRL